MPRESVVRGYEPDELGPGSSSGDAERFGPPGWWTVTTASPERELLLSRRAFGGAVLASVGLAGCIGPSGGQPEPPAVERRGWQVSDVRVEYQYSFVGASATLYNSPRSGERSARIRYRLYDTQGIRRFQAAERVYIPPGKQARVARWWRRQLPASTTPVIEFADVELIERGSVPGETPDGNQPG